MYTSTDQPLPDRLFKYYECGICSCYHPLTWDGDCREDAFRFELEQLDKLHGPHGWECVPMPGGEPDFVP